MQKATRIAVAVALALLIGAPAFAQVTPPTTLSTLDSGSCGAATSCVTYPITGNTLTVDVTVIGTITVTFYSSLDGNTYRAATMTNLNGLAQATTASASGSYFIPNSGIAYVQVRVTSVSGGSAVLKAARGYMALRIPPSGGASSGTTFTASVGFLAPTGCATVPYSYTGDTGTGWCRSAAGRMQATAAGSSMGVVDANGWTFPSAGFYLGVGIEDVHCRRSAAKAMLCDDGTGAALSRFEVLGPIVGQQVPATVYVTSQFDKTSDTTLANITGLSQTVISGGIYTLEGVLFTSSNSAGGIKAAISGTATATTFAGEGHVFSGTSISGQNNMSALNAVFGNVTSVTVGTVVFSGTITVNVGGTLTVQFAQNATNGNPSSVLVGSYFRIYRVA